MTSEEITFTLEDLHKDLISTSKWTETIRRVSDNFKDNYEIVIELTLSTIGLPVDKIEEIFTDEFLNEKTFKNLNQKFDAEDFKPTTLNVANTLKKLWKGVWKSVCSVIKQGSIEERKEYGQSIKCIHEMLSSMSTSEIRNVRFGIVIVAQCLYEFYKQTLIDLEQQLTIVNKTKRGKKQFKKETKKEKEEQNEEKERIEKAMNHVEKLVNHLTKVIIKPRIYDVSRDVRKIACETYLVDFDEEYEDKKKIILDLLYDNEILVRRSAIKMVLDEFNQVNGANTSKSKEDTTNEIHKQLANEIKERILEMKMDVDVETARMAIEIATIFEEWKMMKEAERKEMYRLLCDKNAKIRKQTALYIVSFLNGYVEKFIKSGRAFVIKDKKLLKTVILIRVIMEIVEKETDIPQFNYFALQYLLPEYEEFIDINDIIKFVLGTSSLALFENESSTAFEGHEEFLLGMLFTKMVKGAQRQLTVDEMSIKITTNERKNDGENHLVLSEQIAFHITELYDVVSDNLKCIKWLLRMYKYIEKESMKTETNLNNFKLFLNSVKMKIRETKCEDYELLYHYFELLNEMNISSYPEIQQIVTGIIQEECRVLLNSILDDDMDDGEIELDPQDVLVLLYHYIKIDPLPLLRHRLIHLKDRLIMNEINDDNMIILHIFNYYFLWNKLNETQNDQDFTITHYIEILKDLYASQSTQKGNKKRMDEEEQSKQSQQIYELLGIVCEFYFFMNKDLDTSNTTNNKIQIEVMLDNLLVECKQDGILKEPTLDICYLYDEWPIECLLSCVSITSMNKKVLSDLNAIAGSCGGEIFGRIKKMVMEQLKNTNQDESVDMEIESE